MMGSETLFSMGEARAMVAVAALLFAALALRRAWLVVAEEARRRGLAKTALMLLVSAPLAFWAGGKGGGQRSPDDGAGSGPVAPASVVPRREAAPGLHRYFAPSNFVADMSVFTRPTNAVTPSLWTRHSVCDDFRWALPGYKAGICGAVTTQPWGIDTPQRIKDCYETYAPFYATNALVRGVGDFWAVTNENSKTFVWKDLQYNNSPSNLVSFAATIYDWGDFEFTYGNVPDGGFSSFAKIGAETLDMTQYAASGQTVRVEKNLEQDAEWWLENYPEICYTNATGELVFDYDTNEWCFVQFVVESLEDYLEEEAAYRRYWELRDSMSNDLVRVEKYSVEVFNVDTNDVEASNLPDLVTPFVNMQKAIYGEYIGLDGISVDELPKGIHSNDVVYLGVDSGNTTNIMHWTIEDYSRVRQKIGDPPKGKLTGVDEETIALPMMRSVPGYGVKINLRLRFAVPLGSTLFVTQNTHQVGSWIHRDSEVGAITIPCRSGLAYCAYANHGFNRSGTITNDDTIAWRYANNDRRLYFHRKLSMSIAGVAFTNANFATARAVMTPPVDNGSYSWTASDNIRVEPIGNGRRAGLFLDDGGGGFVKCVWDNGQYDEWRLCATGEVSVASCGEAAYANLTKFIDLRASPSLAVFEDSHLGTNGQPVAASTSTSSLVCSYGGNGAGTLELLQVSGSAVSLSYGGSAVTLPYTWQVAGGGAEPDRVFNVSNLHSGEVAVFCLRFSNDLAPQGIDCQTLIRTVELVVQAGRTWPTERYRHVFGPREAVNLATPGCSGAVSWDFGSGPIPLNPFTYTASYTPGPLTVTLMVDGSSYSFPISIIAPSAVVGTNAVAMTDADWMSVSNAPPHIGEVGAGERIALKVEPEYVSFRDLKIMEGYSDAYAKSGYFEHYHAPNLVHDATAGAYVEMLVGRENDVGFDCAGFTFTADDLPPPWTDGGFEFRIPVFWWVDGATQTNELATHVQSFTLFPDGDSEVSKFGWTAHRGTNGVYQVSGPAGAD